MSGAKLAFSEADLQASAAAYDPARHEAPLVVGHPSHDGPAYGWVKSLAFAGGALDAEPDQVDPAFAEMVGAGRFKKISASFYMPDAPANPVPGVYYLRHVGFLGAQPPAVKGLRAPAFADNEEGVIEFGALGDFADWGDVQNASLWRRMRDWLISEKGLPLADSVVPDYAVAEMEAAARQPEPAAVTATDNAAGAVPAYSEKPQGAAPMTPEQIAEKARLDKQAADQAAEFAIREAAFAEREHALAAAETTRRRTDTAAFVETLVGAGKLLPTHKEGMVAFLCGLDAAQVVAFGEGDKKVTKPGEAWFREYLGAQPKLVEFGERAREGVNALPEDASAQEIAKRAVAYQEAEEKAGRTISVTQAVQHVTRLAAQ